jgi:hypothetical protein
MTFAILSGRGIGAGLILLLVTSLASASDYLVIGDGVTEDSVTPLLTSRGHTVSLFPGNDSAFDGTVDLSPYDAVILLDGEGYNAGMPVTGQNALKAYVGAGGGLLLTEWVAFEFDNRRYAEMGELIPLRRTTGDNGTDTYIVELAHEVTAGLPASFSIPPQGYNVGSAVSGEVLVTGVEAGDAVVVDAFGEGRIVQLATAGNYSGHRPFDQGAESENYNTLFAQAAEWIAGGRCFVVDAIDDRLSVINDGQTADLMVLANDECQSDEPVRVVELPGDLEPDRGGLASTDGALVRYLPADGYVGFEEFRYTAEDAGLQGGSDPPSVDQDSAIVLVEVLADLIPVAVDDPVTGAQNQDSIIDVLANDSLGNAPNTVEVASAPASGTATLQTDDTIRYVPSANFFGEDSFTYRLTDANGDSSIATVTVGILFVSGPVPIDIMPADAGNNLNLRAGPGAGFQVAILSVGEFFDAPNVIDSLSLKFGPRQANIWGAPQVRDIDGDGYDDLQVKFLTQQTGIACGDSHASLSGRTYASQPISGTDAINTFNCPRVRKRH